MVGRPRRDGDAHASAGGLFFAGWALALGFLVLGLGLVVAAPEAILTREHKQLPAFMFLTQDLIWLAVVVFFLPIVGALAWRQPAASLWLMARLPDGGRAIAVQVLLLMAFAIAAVGLVFHHYPLAMDEYIDRFMARIMLEGRFTAEIAAPWRDFAEALRPTFVHLLGGGTHWAAGSLPGNAALIALFSAVGLGPWSHVFLAAGAALVLAMLVRRIFPASPWAPCLAVFLLVSCAQFFLTAATPYSMTSRLLFALLWLWLFTRDDAWGHGLAALVGFAAMGLHQVHVHLFFITPFILHLAFQRRFVLFAAYALWYLAALAIWLHWPGFIAPAPSTELVPGSPPPSLGLVERIELMLSNGRDWSELWLFPAQIGRFFAWLSPPLVLLALLGLRYLGDAPPLIKLLCWSMLTTLLPYLLLQPTQGHGWGYRYAHPLLGNLAVLAVYGWYRFREEFESAVLDRARATLAVVGIAGLVVALPLRGMQAERFVAPFARAMAYIEALDVDAVVLAEDVWYGRDLRRNDPWLKDAPKVLSADLLSAAQLRDLCRGRRVVAVDSEQLRHFGIVPLVAGEDADILGRWHRARMRTAGCQPIDTR